MDPGLAAAAVACGQHPEPKADRSAAAGVQFFYAAQDDTVIETVRFETGALPPGTDLAVPLARRGDVMSPPPKGTMSGRVAFVTVLAETPAACEVALDAAQAALIIEPATPATTG